MRFESWTEVPTEFIAQSRHIHRIRYALSQRRRAWSRPAYAVPVTDAAHTGRFIDLLPRLQEHPERTPRAGEKDG